MNMVLPVFILALAGFAVAFYIHWKKATEQPLTCFIGKECNTIVRSKWGSMFGVSNEALGMLYYFFVAVCMPFLFWSADIVFFLPLSVWVLIAATGAVFFSLFLLGVQIFVFRDWCEYCLASAGINIAIFVIEAVPILALYGIL